MVAAAPLKFVVHLNESLGRIASVGPSGFVTGTPGKKRTRKQTMRRIMLAATSLVAVTALQTPAHASSHREAPMISGMPRLDASDFYFFRSYEARLLSGSGVVDAGGAVGGYLV